MTEQGRLRGRPRRPGVDDDVLAAAVELVTEQGYARTTIDAVARRAAVAKTTVYRRWRSKEALAVDALAVALGSPPPGRPGDDAEAALRELIGWLAARIREKPVRALLLGLLVQAAHDPEARGRLRARFREPFVARVTADWQLQPSAVDVAFDVVVGGLLHRLATSDDIGPGDAETFVNAATNVLFGAAAEQEAAPPTSPGEG